MMTILVVAAILVTAFTAVFWAIAFVLRLIGAFFEVCDFLLQIAVRLLVVGVIVYAVSFLF